jgi:hypothetical protein
MRMTAEELVTERRNQKRFMRKAVCLTALVLVISAAFVLSHGEARAGESYPERQGAGEAKVFRPQKELSPAGGDYVLFGWNNLGMHCINPSFKEIGILPPFNTLWVQVIRRGNPPSIVTDGVTLEYEIVNNKTVTGKSDFWQYAVPLFGKLFNLTTLAPGVGLTGNGLSGKMQPVGDHFEATGIPVLPRDDSMNWNPYQIVSVKLKKGSGRVVKKTEVVLPVSDELNCAKCHDQGMDGTVNIGGGTASVDTNILMVHDFYYGVNGQTSTGPNLLDRRPVLCAECHSDNALGAPGDGVSKPLSQAMHGWHVQFPDAGCYDCHPGKMTQCLRTGIGGMGYLGTEPTCQSGACHGGMQGVAAPGRQAWAQEPSCEQCHGVNYSTGGELYRNAKGHGNGKVYCAACHNSPHAWWPSKLWADNLAPMKMQKSPYGIGNCGVCHTNKLVGDNPHTIYLSGFPW